MYYNLQKPRATYNLNLPNLNSQSFFFHSSLLIDENLRSRIRSSRGLSFRSSLRSKLRRQIFLPLGLLLIPFYSSHALTSQTTRNHIQGSAPYFVYKNVGASILAVDTDGLLSIAFNNGVQYTPSTNTSSPENPIVLPIANQPVSGIHMFIPVDKDSVEFSMLGWKDDDGDTDVTATGTLSLSVTDKYNRAVPRDRTLGPCGAPYRLKLTSTNGSLSTRYGVPRSRSFNASSVTYYVTPNPKTEPEVCFAKPVSVADEPNNDGPSSIWNRYKGFFTQDTRPDYYGKNFPTTGANNMYFDLEIAGNSQLLAWSSVTRGGITATVGNFTPTSVRITLTGPVATASQWNSSNPGLIAKPTLPQTFELIGHYVHNGKKAVKYGFEIKQWFVNRGKAYYTYPSMESWCNKIGYRMPTVKDLTNAKRYEVTGATPSSSGDYYQRRIGASFIAEWGDLSKYEKADFGTNWFWTNVITPSNEYNRFIVHPDDGHTHWAYIGSAVTSVGLCTLP